MKAATHGAWAQHVKKLRYTAARRREALKTHSLVGIDKNPANRELIVRNDRLLRQPHLSMRSGKAPLRWKLRYFISLMTNSPRASHDSGDLVLSPPVGKSTAAQISLAPGLTFINDTTLFTFLCPTPWMKGKVKAWPRSSCKVCIPQSRLLRMLRKTTKRLSTRL
jgi:hypothetical protein